MAHMNQEWTGCLDLGEVLLGLLGVGLHGLHDPDQMTEHGELSSANS
jgi:hypothetical protein